VEWVVLMAKKGTEIVKANMGGFALTTFALISDCKGDVCNIYQICKHKKSGPCGFRAQNISGAISFYLRVIPEGSEWQGRTIGLQLVPTWDNYLRAYIACSTASLLLDGVAGQKANPLFLMQERFMKQILKLEDMLGLPHVGMIPPDESPDEIDQSKLIDGDPSFYETMSQGIEGGGGDDFGPEDV